MKDVTAVLKDRKFPPLMARGPSQVNMNMSIVNLNRNLNILKRYMLEFHVIKVHRSVYKWITAAFLALKKTNSLR